MYINEYRLHRQYNWPCANPATCLFDFSSASYLGTQDIVFLRGCVNSAMLVGMRIIQKFAAKRLKADVTILSSVSLSSGKVMPSVGVHLQSIQVNRFSTTGYRE